MKPAPGGKYPGYAADCSHKGEQKFEVTELELLAKMKKSNDNLRRAYNYSLVTFSQRRRRFDRSRGHLVRR